VLVSFPLRVSPLCELARERIAAGHVGTPEHVLAVNYVPYGTVYWEQEYRNYSITGGLFLQKATHDFDYLCYLLDSRITRVAATAHYGGIFGGNKPANLRCSACDEQETCLESPQNRRRNGSGGSLEDHPCVFSVACGTAATGTNEDTSSALVEFASGVHGVYTQVFFSRRDAAARGATVSGYHGTIDFDWYRNELRYVRHHRPFTDHVGAGQGLSHFGGDAELGRNFVGMIAGMEKSRAPIQAGIASVYACLAARESARTGRFVEVRQPG
jgi:predicted dehydrogenase